MKKQLCLRVLAGLALPVGSVLACYAALYPEHSVGCLFYRLTGRYCAGCGSGRAVAALLHGELRAAFSYNALLFLLGGPSVLIFLHEYLRFLFPGLGLRPIHIPQPAAWSAVALILSFWVLRNVPAFSFLAP